MIILGIETSCDDTSLALYSSASGVIENVTASQLEHEEFGGIVPEIASRQHIKTILPVFEELLSRSGVERRDIDGIGVSNGPGLVGSLLVGVGFAKSLAMALSVPLVGVHHIESHILSNELAGSSLEYPCVVLVVSGGHTALFHIPGQGVYNLVGNTRDDAAGEAFDKIAKLLGLGFPGGPVVQKCAENGRSDAIDFPRAMRKSGNFDFSFSGLKTAVRLYVEKAELFGDEHVADIAASAQAAIVDILIEKTIGCAAVHNVRHVYLAGGVAANQPLRTGMEAMCRERGMSYHAPLLKYCMDNGAMVARAAEIHLHAGRHDGIDLDVFARGTLSPWL